MNSKKPMPLTFKGSGLILQRMTFLNPCLPGASTIGRTPGIMFGQPQFLPVSGNQLKTIWERTRRLACRWKKGNSVENIWEDQESVCIKARRTGFTSFEENLRGSNGVLIQEMLDRQCFTWHRGNSLWKIMDKTYCEHRKVIHIDQAL